MKSYHIPVLLKASVDGLNIKPDGTYADVTFGGGGHSREILNRLRDGRLIAFDHDLNAEQNAPDDPRFLFLRQNFIYLKNNLKYLGITEIDGLIADLGVSSYQFDTAERGFSFRLKGPLDMRMNKDAELSAADLIRKYPEEKLLSVFKEFGEIRNSGKLCDSIIKYRKRTEITLIEVFMDAISPCIPVRNKNKYLAKVFQALRIEVNKELEGLKKLLVQCEEVIREGGRMVILTYHSLEDRLVKNFIRYGNFKPVVETDFFGNKLSPFEAVNRKVIVPDLEEVKHNPRARSAKLRIAKRCIRTDHNGKQD